MKINSFWVVTKNYEHSTLADILFKDDWAGMRLQFLGGLKAKEIVGVYMFKHEALKAAKKEMMKKRRKREW